MSKFETTIPAPRPRDYKLRLTPKLRGMKPGMSVVLKDEVARCLAAFIRRNGGRPIMRTQGDFVRVWWQ